MTGGDCGVLRVGALYGPLEKIGESTITVPAFDSAGFLAHYRRVGHHGACVCRGPGSRMKRGPRARGQRALAGSLAEGSVAGT